eukprot:TRINITY_DN8441_c0_g1_i11.p3 TRINITY_DN8441_c0_g1~~TRINITY_DN8441_c0_g1_i11.p3  ORF type:complete len:140 (+),score=58.08 TRINITY_DN8441_c0_g1_i11:84-503(+)
MCIRDRVSTQSTWGIQYQLFIIMPPKKKEKSEPNVTIPEGDPVAGKKIFEGECSACHALEGDAKTAAAPPLGKLFGRAAGATGFKYSKAMAGSGIVWSDKHLWEFLKAPGKYVPGLKMSYPGLAGEKDRADLIAYIADS